MVGGRERETGSNAHRHPTVGGLCIHVYLHIHLIKVVKIEF